MTGIGAGPSPEKAALIEDGRVLTFGALEDRVTRAAQALAALGVGGGSRVAVQSHNSILVFEANSAIVRLGATYVPINFRLRGPEIEYIVNDSGAAAVLAGLDFVPHVEAARAGFQRAPACVALAGPTPPGGRDYERLLAPPPHSGTPAPAAGSAEGGSLIYTSGTTGNPKGVYRPRGLPPEAIYDTIQAFGLRGDDVHLEAGPGYHSAVHFFCGLTNGLGGTVVVMPRFDAEEALQLIERYRVTTTFMAPTLVQRMLDLPAPVRERRDVSSLRALILGAAPCPFTVKERAQAYFGEILWEFYGATETGISLILRPEDQLKKPGAAGRPTPGQEIRLLDEEGREVPEGEPGELWVRGAWLATYYNRPDATARSMRDGFFSVGDIAYRDRDGFYYICDRKLDMVISGGVNIYPAEVEACLHSHPGVEDVAVIGVPDDHWGESVKALVVKRQGADLSADGLIAWCRNRIADYKRPRSVDFVDDLPRDSAGKLLKRLIRHPYWQDTGRKI
jgi:acyl-CoA synthetase (AMP-forming)/AMP-acid ligase II